MQNITRVSISVGQNKEWWQHRQIYQVDYKHPRNLLKVRCHHIDCRPSLKWITKIWARFLSPILKPKSLEFFPTSHLIVFYLHSKWLGSQVTCRNPKWLRLLTWEISWFVLTSLFVFCIFLNQYIWYHIICFITYLQEAVRIIFIDKVGVRCHRLRQHRRWCMVTSTMHR